MKLTFEEISTLLYVAVDPEDRGILVETLGGDAQRIGDILLGRAISIGDMKEYIERKNTAFDIKNLAKRIIIV